MADEYTPFEGIGSGENSTGDSLFGLAADAIKTHLIPTTVTAAVAGITCASEADVLNVALFGQTAKQWRDSNPDSQGNMRDHATLEQLLVLSKMKVLMRN